MDAKSLFMMTKKTGKKSLLMLKYNFANLSD